MFMNSRITVGGNILSELSEKIPSYLVAINELIKNSYDAGAKNVSIILDSHKKVLSIIDNGHGMEKSDIDRLFHISTSEKKYGRINEYNRYTQGSKGLGFLAAFKFGSKVEWITNKTSGLKFSVNFDKLVKSPDISKRKVNIKACPSQEIGTTVKIYINSKNLDIIHKFFTNEKNYKKIIKSMYDDDFMIEVKVDGEILKSGKTSRPLENCKERQLYNIKYNSDTGKILFSNRGYDLLTVDFPHDSSRYRLELDLTIFHMMPRGKENIDPLFLNDQGELTPLIYVNTNLFNNYNLFDPNIMRRAKSTQSLPQMIGFIHIYSSDESINFNSDRTQFVQNQLTDTIIHTLEKLNKTIQIEGSIRKKYLFDLNFLKTKEINIDECQDFSVGSLKEFIQNDFAFRDNVAIEVGDDSVSYSFCGETQNLPIVKNGQCYNIGKNNTSQQKILKAIINIKSAVETHQIPTGQIDLKEYITQASDSQGNEIPIMEIEISEDGKPITGGILASVTSHCTKNIEFRYNDPRTGLVVKKLVLYFEKRSSKITASKSKRNLIATPIEQDYEISFDVNVMRLVNQINNLDINSYLEVISCSLRAILELSAESIATSSKTKKILDGRRTNLEDEIFTIVKYISEKSLLSKIAHTTNISYHTLKNVLESADIKSLILKAHLGAHKSSKFASSLDIDSLAKFIGTFLIITNELINNKNITL